MRRQQSVVIRIPPAFENAIERWRPKIIGNAEHVAVPGAVFGPSDELIVDGEGCEREQREAYGPSNQLPHA